MVLDIGDNHHHRRSHGGDTHRAPAHLPRFAAFVVDLAIYSLVGSALMAPLQRNFREGQITGETDNMAFALLFAAFVFVLGGILYQTIFVATAGATPGKRVFGIKVVDVWTGKKPSWIEAFYRACLWWGGLFLLGLPYLGILTDPRGRGLHDRIADTMTLPQNKRLVSSPLSPEMRTAIRGASVFLIAAFLVGFLSEAYVQFHRTGSDDWMSSIQDLSVEHCDAVDQVEKGEEETSRLAVALSLFAAGVVENECLEQEAVSAFRTGKEKDLAYLARAFAYSDDQELSDAYLTKVCEIGEGSEACEFAKLIEAWTNEDWETASKGFRRLLPGSGLFMKVWAVKHFERVKEFDDELSVIREIGPRREIASFLGSHRVVALWGLHRRDEARAAMISSLENMDVADRMSLSSWICYREVSDGCPESLPDSCRSFVTTVEQNEDYLSSSSIAATDVQVQECSGDKVDYSALASRQPRDDARMFVRALELLSLKEERKAREILKRVADSETSDRVFSFEARKKLVQIAQSKEELQPGIQNWREMDRTTWEWRAYGQTLAAKYLELGDYKNTAGVSSIVLQEDPRDKKSHQMLVHAYYKTGQKNLAWALLKREEGRSSKGARRPASAPTSLDKLADEFEEIRGSLEREHGK